MEHNNKNYILHLPYFDAIRSHDINATCKLLLGTAKAMVKIWKDTLILAVVIWNYSRYIYCVNKMQVLAVIGRSLYNILTHISGFAADQWPSWTCI